MVESDASDVPAPVEGETKASEYMRLKLRSLFAFLLVLCVSLAWLVQRARVVHAHRKTLDQCRGEATFEPSGIGKYLPEFVRDSVDPLWWSRVTAVSIPSATDSDLQALLQFKQVVALELWGGMDELTPQGVQTLRQLEHLTQLHVEMLDPLPKEIVESIVSLKQLEELMIEVEQGTHLASLADLPRLRLLYLWVQHGDDLQSVRLPASLDRLSLRLMNELPVLSADSIQPALSGCPNLATLSVSQCMFDVDTARLIGRQKELRVLDLNFTDVTDTHLSAFESLQHLEDISLSGTNVTEQGVLRLCQTSSTLTRIGGIDGIAMSDESRKEVKRLLASSRSAKGR